MKRNKNMIIVTLILLLSLLNINNTVVYASDKEDNTIDMYNYINIYKRTNI